MTFSALADHVAAHVADQVPDLIGGGAKQSPNLKADLSGRSPVLVPAAGPRVAGGPGREAGPSTTGRPPAADPGGGQARHRQALAALKQNRPEEALAHYRAAHKADPALGLPELQMAAGYNSQGDVARTEDWLKKAVAAHPEDPEATRAYASWLLDAGRPADARPLLDAAARRDPAARETRALVGLLARYRKDYPAAERVFEGLHRDHPNDPFAAWNLALVLAESGAPDKRRRAVEVAEAESRRNRQPEALAVLGWCYYKAGRLDDAEKALGAAAATGNVTRDAAYFVGRVLADRQRWADAAKAVRAAIDGKGAFVYQADARALLAEAERKRPGNK